MLYTGFKSTTLSGQICQRWDTDDPHTVADEYKDNPQRFPEKSLTGAKNYCRQPDGIKFTPWCYTTDSDKRWEYCFDHECEGENYSW